MDQARRGRSIRAIHVVAHGDHYRRRTTSELTNGEVCALRIRDYSEDCLGSHDSGHLCGLGILVIPLLTPPEVEPRLGPIFFGPMTLTSGAIPEIPVRA